MSALFSAPNRLGASRSRNAFQLEFMFEPYNR